MVISTRTDLPPPKKRVQNTKKVNFVKAHKQMGNSEGGTLLWKIMFFSNLQGKNTGFGVRTPMFAGAATY